jgi:hypothetical protein
VTRPTPHPLLILRGAATTFSCLDYYTTEAAALNAYGAPVLPWDDEAEKFDVYGVIMRYGLIPYPDRSEALYWIAAALRDQGYYKCDRIFQHSHVPVLAERLTREQALAVVERAIVLFEQDAKLPQHARALPYEPEPRLEPRGRVLGIRKVRKVR